MSAVAVIPCLNERRHIAGLIDHLLADEAWTDPLVLVADGGSSDGCREIVEDIARRDPRVRLVDNPARLQAAGVNRAARLADDRRWLVRVDAHADYPPNFVSTLVGVAERAGATSVVVPMHTVGRTCFETAAAAAQNSVLGNGGSRHRGRGQDGYVDHGHHALFDMAQFIALGGYDETFSHNEDAEFDTRSVRAGGRIWMTSEAPITYYPRASLGALFRQYINYGAGRARTMLRHRAPTKLRQLAPAGVAPAVILAVGGLVWAPLALPAFVWATGVLAFGLLLGLRARSGCVALSGVAAGAMHLGWSIGFWRTMTGALTRQAPPFVQPAAPAQ